MYPNYKDGFSGVKNRFQGRFIFSSQNTFGKLDVMFTNVLQIYNSFHVFVCRYKACAMEFLRMRKQWKLQATLTYMVCICLTVYSKYFQYSGKIVNLQIETGLKKVSTRIEVTQE